MGLQRWKMQSQIIQATYIITKEYVPISVYSYSIMCYNQFNSNIILKVLLYKERLFSYQPHRKKT